MSVCVVCLTENFDVRKIGIQTPEEDRRKTEDEKIFWKFEVKYFSRKCKCLADLKKKIQPRKKKFSALFDAENYAEIFFLI